MNFDDTLTSCILLVQFMKLQQKNKAIELRKKGKSYKEILNHVNVSKGTLSLWLRDVKLSEKQKARLYGLREKNLYKLAKNKQKQRIAQTRAIIRSAKSSIHRLTQKDLLLIGVALYWAEGDKSKKTEQVKFTNSDPQMIALIMRWFRDVCNVKEEKIRQVIKDTETRVIKEDIALSLKGAIFNTRRQFISEVVEECMIQVEEKEHSKYYNQKIDRFLTHPAWGIPIFFTIMLGIYQISFGNVLGLGTWLTDQFDVFWADIFTAAIGSFLTFIGIEGFAYGLIIDGILAGVGGVLIFLPQILILFFLLALLEGTGYMARVAIVMDQFLSKFGLNGKSIVPMITGFGCTVPAIMATRTIADKKERILTILTIPFISCSARIPIYIIFINIPRQ